MKMLLVVQDFDFWAAREGMKISSVLLKSSTFEAFFHTYMGKKTKM
jgi:hypothetical protein